ncbi:hypothetical protein BELL_0482g00030 [Botrytis elliptica]|uniref:Uncharacterized protein n=1 Tax=Botrytis elliptica TaxID=278938 RepID=A0A4Z1JEX4_9HELO|nr:hypothetical protein BELL_0482g00030 [Botrytis elliptica]
MSHISSYLGNLSTAKDPEQNVGYPNSSKGSVTLLPKNPTLLDIIPRDVGLADSPLATQHSTTTRRTEITGSLENYPRTYWWLG